MSQKAKNYTKEKKQLLQSLILQAKRKGYIQAETIRKCFSRYNPSEEEFENFTQQIADAGIDIVYIDQNEESIESESIEIEGQTFDFKIPNSDTSSSALVDPLQLYLNEIHKYPTLSYKETLALVHKVRSGDCEAREYLINCNLKFAFTVALKYVQSGIPLLDLIQQANIGLTVAADRYSPHRGTRFTSYAIFWIKQSILSYINNTVRLIRLPEYICIELNNLHNFESAFIAENQRKPTDDELATLSGFSIARVKYLKNLDYNIISTESQPDDEMDGTIEDILTNGADDEDQHKEFYQDECRALIQNLLLKLTPRQRDVIVLRFGLDPKISVRPLSLEETGKILGISKESVRQTETLALKRLRRMPGISSLYPYLEL